MKTKLTSKKPKLSCMPKKQMGGQLQAKTYSGPKKKK
jgi:hypothetical protein